VIDQLFDLLWRHSFAQECGDFLDFLPDVLFDGKFNSLSFFTELINYY
jgi:hypothetical protein